MCLQLTTLLLRLDYIAAHFGGLSPTHNPIKRTILHIRRYSIRFDLLSSYCPLLLLRVHVATSGGLATLLTNKILLRSITQIHPKTFKMSAHQRSCYCYWHSSMVIGCLSHWLLLFLDRLSMAVSPSACNMANRPIEFHVLLRWLFWISGDISSGFQSQMGSILFELWRQM